MLKPLHTSFLQFFIVWMWQFRKAWYISPHPETREFHSEDMFLGEWKIRNKEEIFEELLRIKIKEEYPDS